MSLLLRAPVAEVAFPWSSASDAPWDDRQRPWAALLGYDVTSVVRVGPKSSHYPQVTPIGWRRVHGRGWMGTASRTKEDPVKGRSGAHALSSGPSIGGQELIMKAAAVLDVPELLTTAEVSALLRVNRSTLSRWRSAGAGPRVTWLTANIPRYQRDHVIEWIRQASA